MDLPRIQRFGDRDLLVEWRSVISDHTHSCILGLVEFLNSCDDKGIIEVTSTYCSVAIYLSKMSNIELVGSLVKDWLAKEVNFVDSLPKRIIEIPVCYDQVFGLDLEEMSQALELPISEIIRRHTAPFYRVYFLGFLPGFPYLGGLDNSLCVSRKITPRILVEKGSVAIGGCQTGIYTFDSPGGWNILGKTPLSIFEVSHDSPALLSAGDFIKFKSISSEEYLNIERNINNGVYKNTAR